jgi:hypothetical protein
MTAIEIAEYEQTKEMYRKMGIDIESVWRQQAWEALKPVRKALVIQAALKTETVIEVEHEQQKTNDAEIR